MFASPITEATEFFSALPTIKNTYKPSVSAIKQIISLTTDESSVDKMKQLFGVTMKMKSTFNEICAHMNPEQFKEMTKSTDHLVVEMNGLSESIDQSFDQEGSEIIIDDQMMIDFLKYLKASKENLLHVSDYSHIMIDVNKAKEEITAGNFEKYTIEEFLQKVNAAQKDMYSLICPNSVMERIQKFNKTSPSINHHVRDLTINPLGRAKKTGKPHLPEYYMNAGRFSVLFDINEVQEEITILGIFLRSTLWKIIAEKSIDLPLPPI